jgi:hypothetical protein
MPLPTIAIPNFSGGSVTVNTPASARQAAADSAAVVLSTEDKADLAGIRTAVESTAPDPVYDAYTGSYEAVAASATDQIMGATGSIGDKLSHVVIQPASTSPGNVIIKDGGTTIYTFPGGASSVTTLNPIVVPFGLIALGAGFKITTGANVSAVGIGKFT